MDSYDLFTPILREYLTRACNTRKIVRDVEVRCMVKSNGHKPHENMAIRADHVHYTFDISPDSKAHGANMGPTWGRQVPGRPHVGPINLAIWVTLTRAIWYPCLQFLWFIGRFNVYWWWYFSYILSFLYIQYILFVVAAFWWMLLKHLMYNKAYAIYKVQALWSIPFEARCNKCFTWIIVKSRN